MQLPWRAIAIVAVKLPARARRWPVPRTQVPCLQKMPDADVPRNWLLSERDRSTAVRFDQPCLAKPHTKPKRQRDNPANYAVALLRLRVCVRQFLVGGTKHG